MSELPPLTADVIARAIVAAARSYGDDPVVAMTTKTGTVRRALAPAMYGVREATGWPMRQLARVMRMDGPTMRRARLNGGEKFTRAQAAAVTALTSGELPAPPVETPEDRRLAMLAQAVRAKPAVVVPTPHRVAPGPVTAYVAGPVYRAAPTGKPIVLRDKIMAQLVDAPSTAPSLAILTGAKELAVSETLRVMEHEGAVLARPVPPEGKRYREWVLA
jgi:hypothetical protein